MREKGFAKVINYYIEPAITIKVGNKNVKFYSQVVRSYNLSYNDIKATNYLISFGIEGRLNTQAKGAKEIKF